ncbi:CHASE2 domain-containing protein [Desulfuromonas carbonis]
MHRRHLVAATPVNAVFCDLREGDIKRLENRFRPLAFLLALVLGALCYFWDPSLLARFALPLEDCKFAVRESLGQQPVLRPNLVIVTVDERSINQLGRWPWNRKVLAKLMLGLGQARLVGLDMIFADVADADQDTALAAAIEEAGNVVAGFFFRSQATTWTSEADLDHLAEWGFRDIRSAGGVTGLKDSNFVETNLPEINAGALAGGFFNAEPDPDGLYRRYPIAYLHQGFALPSLAVQMARYDLDREPVLSIDSGGLLSFVLGDVKLSGSSLRLNYGSLAAAPLVSAVDIIDGTLPPEFFRDKLVLVGVTEVGIFDLRPTPVAAVTPGVWLHATALSNLLEGRLLRTAPFLDLTLLALTLLLAWAAGRQRRIGARVATYLLLVLGVLAAANALLIGADLWTREFYILFPFFLFATALETESFVQTELRAGQLKRAFTSYVSPEVVREILEDPDKLDLGGVEREVSILFSDIRGFTSLSEKVTAPQLVQMLNQIHDPMTQVVLQQRGMLDKYIGDAMMALFNTPLHVEDHPDRAVASALGIVACLKEINAGFERLDLPQIDVGVGVNTGGCIVGNMGSKVRFEYTAIGDAVNLASRLEGLCKVYRVRIVISEFTRDRLAAPFLVRLLDRVRVKGKHLPVAIYEVMADEGNNRSRKEEFESALELYFKADFARAAQRFGALVAATGDPPAAVFLDRCQAFVQTPPPADWDGVFDLQNK